MSFPPSLLHHFTPPPPLEAQCSPKRRKSFELHFPKKSSHCSPTLTSFWAEKFNPGNSSSKPYFWLCYCKEQCSDGNVFTYFRWKYFSHTTHTMEVVFLISRPASNRQYVNEFVFLKFKYNLFSLHQHKSTLLRNLVSNFGFIGSMPAIQKLRIFSHVFLDLLKFSYIPIS